MTKTPYYMGRGISYALLFVALLAAVWLVCTWVEQGSSYYKAVEHTDAQKRTICGQGTPLGPYRETCEDNIVRHPIWAAAGVLVLAVGFWMIVV